MDRNEGIIRWSPNLSRDEFMVFNLNNRVVHLYEATGYAQPGNFDYEKVSKHTEFPAINTYDWSPVNRGLVAVGTGQGEVHLLRVDDNSNASLTLPLKLQRPCQSVTFNTTGLLAVGLDRVRNDSCLQIWDINQRLAGLDLNKKGWNVPTMNLEPRRKLEASVSITAIRFFEDQPQTLVVGVKNQSVRIHDLRDPSSSVITFQTRCCNNIAIDYTDTNYFASSSLDQPGLVVWDRRASNRSTASAMYLESFDQEELPWGAALKLDRAIEVDKSVYIKQLRYSREERGAIGVLSSAGQLQVLQTKREYVEPDSLEDVQISPEILEVETSFDLEYAFFDPDHKRKYEHRIVSFDWLNLGTSDLQTRVVALRANGDFEILQVPTETYGQLSQLIPWKPPHRLEDPYMSLMNFEDASEKVKVRGPLFATAVKLSVPVFGPEKFQTPKSQKLLKEAIKESMRSEDPVDNLLALSDLEMRQSQKLSDAGTSMSQIEGKRKQLGGSEKFTADFSSPDKVFTSREVHGKLHYSSMSLNSSNKPRNKLLEHVMLRRAFDGYLFDSKVNKMVFNDDQWLKDLWEWIQGAEEAAQDDRMVSRPLDLSYMGVYTIWMNLLGEKAHSRLIDSVVVPDASQWERLIANINKRSGRPHFQGVATTKPHHRQLCLAICGLSKSADELDEDLDALEEQKKYTTAAAWALFEGIPKRAVEILKRGGTDLLFVAMALDIKLQSTASLELDKVEWGKALGNHPEMAEDSYLRAIYGYITTGDWAVIADETALPLRDRVGVALRHFDDDKLTEWLSIQMKEASRNGDIEGIVLAGITDNMVDILTKYVEKFRDYQTPILIMSFCFPRFISDIRCDAWHKAYKDFLQRHKNYILRVKFEQQSTIKSRLRDGLPVIKPPPRQVTIRCLNCDAHAANDLGNSGVASFSGSFPGSTTIDPRNPLAATGINAGLCCPRCGSHLSRCAVCMGIVGVPRSDRPEQSVNAEIRRMANFPTFCLKCKHVMHMDHSVDWFRRHNECPVPECRCQCNAMASRQTESIWKRN